MSGLQAATVLPRFEGGYTDIELRAFREAAEVAGVFHPCLPEDSHGPLSDTQGEEIISS
jgi:hypothetical protein